ncbi:MAG: MATE family efflux transporter [Kiritimatiellae bacterium]|nr:MATE family efflux transporter [Kiritimatiellia bacterium]
MGCSRCAEGVFFGARAPDTLAMQTYDLTTGPVRPLLRKLAMPAAIGIFCNTLYNLTDTYFAGKLSTAALAGLSVSFPVFFSIIAVGAGLSAGTTALIAFALGRGDIARARLLAAQSLSFGIIAGVLLTIVGLIFMRPLFVLLGASGDYLASAVQYMRIVFIGAVFFVGSYAVNAGLVARGDTHTLRNMLAVGALLNAGLDPWFMFGGLGIPAMGLSGAALSTILIQAGGLCYMIYRARRAGLFTAETWGQLRPRGEPFRRIFGQGAPSALNHVTIGVGIFVITYFASRFGDVAVAGYGVATRIEQVVLLPVLGLTSATLAIAGQSLGAGRIERVREAWHAGLREGLLVMLVGGALMFLFARPAIGLFASESNVVAIGVGYLHVTVFVLYAYVFLFITTSLLQAIQQPMYALWIGLYRQILAPLALYPLLTGRLGIFGLWLGVGLVTWSAALFTLAWGRRALRKLAHRSD